MKLLRVKKYKQNFIDIDKKNLFQVICLVHSAVPDLANWHYCIAVNYSTAVEINGRASANKFMEAPGLAWGIA